MVVAARGNHRVTEDVHGLVVADQVYKKLFCFYSVYLQLKVSFSRDDFRGLLLL